MKKQKIRIMVLLFLLFAVMLLILSFTNFNYSKKTLEEQMNMELEQLMFPGFRNGHDSLPSRSFSYVILEIGENNEITSQQSSPAWDYSAFDSPLSEKDPEEQDSGSPPMNKKSKQKDAPSETTVETSSSKTDANNNEEIFTDESSEVLNTIVKKILSKRKSSGTFYRYKLHYLLREEGQKTLILGDYQRELSILNKQAFSTALLVLVLILLFLPLDYFFSTWAIRPSVQAMEKQKQFISDAGHELKTPLAVIAANLSLLEDQNLAPETGDFVQNIAVMSKKMQELVEKLLQLSRLEQQIFTYGEMDYSRRVAEICLQMEALFFEEGMELEVAVEQNIILKHAIESQVEEVLRIFLDNGRKYADKPSTLYVKLYREKNMAVLSVDSAGRSLSKAEFEKVFSRFTRLDEARSQSESFGLGLSIAKEIAGNHKGKIYGYGKNGRNCFVLALPIQ
ncbi:sensor histidine kinase [Oribacterium sinus]|uniref:histidine kinase n=1 Tax=Oribacterium sinus TaxID=237576 RepID=A0A930DMC1_9FIRM|nr:HAMP domain-containing sensor histidine kinase [Oribacterium sinus]MBF1272485.1 HAMP domain-containing histidine kinase [Oribacterium sinus]